MTKEVNRHSFLKECLHDTSTITISKHEMDLQQHHSINNCTSATELFNTGRKRVRVEERQENEKRDFIDMNFSCSSKLECNVALTNEHQGIEFKQNFGRKMNRRNSKVGQMFFKEDDSFQPSIKCSNNFERMSKKRRSSIGSTSIIDRYGIHCIPEREENKVSAPIVSANDIARTQLEEDLHKLILK